VRKVLYKAYTPKREGGKNDQRIPQHCESHSWKKKPSALKNQLRKAEIIIEAQKKISEILGIDQNLNGLEDNR
jgi:ribosomal protein L35